MVRSPFTSLIFLFVSLALVACSKGRDHNEPVAGLDARPDNQTCIAPDVLGAQPTNIGLEAAYPDLPHLGFVLALSQPPAPNIYLQFFFIYHKQIYKTENTSIL